MSNLNSLSNSNNISNNISGSKFKFLGSNKSMIIVMVVALLLVILIFGILMIIITTQTPVHSETTDHSEEVLLKYIHDCKNNPLVITGKTIPKSTLANEYSMTFWVYINSLEKDYLNQTAGKTTEAHQLDIITKGKIETNGIINTLIVQPLNIFMNTGSTTLKTSFKFDNNPNYGHPGCYHTINSYLVSKINNSTIKTKFAPNFEITNKSDITLNTKDMFFTLHKNFKITFTLKLLGNIDLSTVSSDVIYNLINFTDKGASPLIDFNFKFDFGVKEFIMSGTHSTPTQKIKDGYDVAKSITVAKTINIVIQSSNDKIIAGFTETIDPAKVATYHILKDTHTVEQSDCKVFFSKDATSGWKDGTSSDNSKKLFEISDFNYENLDETTSANPYLDTDIPTSQGIGLKSYDECKEEAKRADTQFFGMIYPRIDKTVPITDKAECYLLSSEDYKGSSTDVSKKGIKGKYGKVKDNLCIGKKTDSGTDAEKNFAQNLGSLDYMFINNVFNFESRKPCEIQHFPLERWNCVTLNVHNNVCDLFFDGKLFHTCVFDGNPELNEDPIVIGNNGGFDGYISNVTWSSKALNPGEIYDKYKRGPRMRITANERIRYMFSKKPDEIADQVEAQKIPDKTGRV